MKKLLALILFLPLTATAQWQFDNSGGRIFDMRDNKRKTISITIESVDPKDIKAACNKKSLEFGYGGFNNVVPMACAFWRGKSCHIIMPHKIDMRTVGHEIMHCYQEDWHN
jgi:hypothetical protein